ncbi:MAG TPA: hypothetical protein ENJ54_04120 [Chloroflexi bacterium]|nr:hypothetical protein [Chloroflexota bacterium]
MKEQPLPPGAPVAAYLRDSGGEEQELSLAQQETEIRAWCEARGLALTRIFRDEARPGSSVVGREGFQQMMRHFRSGEAPEKALIIWKYSRFSRDIDDAQFYRADLRRRGVRVISLHDQIPEGPAGRLYEAALDWMNQQFLIDLSTDVKRGLRHIVAQYGCVPGTPPRGFKRVPVVIGKRRDGSKHICHRWEPDPDLVPLIRRAFEMRAAGTPISQIHAKLHLYRTLNAYTTFFRNPIYVGILKYGGETYEGYCEPIVAPQTWRTVQKIMEDNAERFGRRHPRRVNSPFLLSGIAYCGQCGAPLYGHVTTRPGKGRDEAYRCTRAKRKAGCDAPRIPRHILEKAVLEALIRHILTPENLAQIQQTHRAAAQRRQAERQAQARALRKRQSALRKRITNITAAIAQAGPLPSLLTELKELETEKAVIEAQLQELQRPQPEPRELTPEEITQISERLIHYIQTADKETQRRLLRGLIAKITVTREGDHIEGVIQYYTPLAQPPPPFPPTPRGPDPAAPAPSGLLPIHFSPVGAQPTTFNTRRHPMLTTTAGCRWFIMHLRLKAWHGPTAKAPLPLCPGRLLRWESTVE